jgi:sec-independent protein translocase protein TatA
LGVGADERESPVIDISPIQILIVLAIALLVFGPKRLPEMGRSIGRGIREFRGSLSDDAPPAPRGRPAPPPPQPAARAPEDDDEALEGIVVPGDAPPPPRTPGG